MDLQMRGELDVATAVNENVATALFVMLEAFPWTFFVSIVGILLLVSFFVTSSDSGSLVVEPPHLRRKTRLTQNPNGFSGR